MVYWSCRELHQKAKAGALQLEIFCQMLLPSASFHRCWVLINILHPKLHLSIYFWGIHFVTADISNSPGKQTISRGFGVGMITIFDNEDTMTDSRQSADTRPGTRWHFNRHCGTVMVCYWKEMSSWVWYIRLLRGTKEVVSITTMVLMTTIVLLMCYSKIIMSLSNMVLSTRKSL